MAEQFAKFVKGIDLGQEGDSIDRLHFGKTPMVCMFLRSVHIGKTYSTRFLQQVSLSRGPGARRLKNAEFFFWISTLSV